MALDYGGCPGATTVDSCGNVFVTGSDGTLELGLVEYVPTLVVPPQPSSCTNAVGSAACLGVEVVGTLALSYPWRRGEADLGDGSNVSGVTTTNVVVSDVHHAKPGGYSVVVINPYGSATTTVAQLTVVVSPSASR